jgi:hypothetical protein
MSRQLSASGFYPSLINICSTLNGSTAASAKKLIADG